MTELDLYKFLNENKLEYNVLEVAESSKCFSGYTHNKFDEKLEIWMFVPFYLLEDFNKILGFRITDEEGLNVVFKDGYICFNMVEICDYFDIDYTKIFDK